MLGMCAAREKACQFEKFASTLAAGTASGSDQNSRRQKSRSKACEHSEASALGQKPEGCINALQVQVAPLDPSTATCSSPGTLVPPSERECTLSGKERAWVQALTAKLHVARERG